MNENKIIFFEDYFVQESSMKKAGSTNQLEGVNITASIDTIDTVDTIDTIDAVEALTAVQDFLPNALNLIETMFEDRHNFWQVEDPHR